MSNDLGLDLIDSLTGGRIGTFDIACPLCGPLRRSPVNQRRPVLRIYRIDQGFAGYCCARCGEKGSAHDRNAPAPDPLALARARAEAAERQRVTTAERLRKAKWVWSQRLLIHDGVAKPARTYLRETRGYDGPLLNTLGFLPARGEHAPALIAAFGLPTEPEPGILQIRAEDVRGVHITRLTADGRGKAGGIDKIMIGHSAGSPIVLTPPNDLLGLAIAEGIEDALSTHEATGLGAWAAGSASRLPALAGLIPAYVECVTVVADADAAGRTNAEKLAAAIPLLNRDVRLIVPPQIQSGSATA